MTHRTGICLVFVFLSLSCLSQIRSPAGQVFDNTKNSVVMILAASRNGKEAQVAQGSGFVIGKDQVATNRHVIEGMTEAVVLFQDGRTEPVKGATPADNNQDLVILSVRTRGVPALPLGDEMALHEGDRVLALGAPKGLNLTLTDGIVSSFRKIQGTVYVQSTAVTNHGSSGGPLLNESGQVIGITTLGLPDAPGIYFAVGISVLKQLLKRSPLAVIPLAQLQARAGKGSASEPSDEPDDGGKEASDPIADLIKAGKYNQARELIHAALEHGERSSDLYVQAGVVECELGNPTESLRYLDKALAIDPKNRFAHGYYVFALSKLGEFAHAISHAQAFARLKPGIDAQLLLAETYYISGRYAEAKNFATAALKLSPDDPYALRILTGIVYWSTPFNEELWKQYVAELQDVAPHAIWVNVHRSRLAFLISSNAGELSDLDDAIKDGFPDPAPYLMKVDAYVRRNDLAGAGKEILRALQAYPYHPAVLGAASYLDLLNHQDAEAAQYIDLMKELQMPFSAELERAQCAYALRTGNNRVALASCAKVASADPRNVQFKLHHAWALLDSGAAKQAALLFDDADNLPLWKFDELINIRLRLGMFLTKFTLGDSKAAADMLKALRQSHPKAVDPASMAKLPILWSDDELKRLQQAIQTTDKQLNAASVTAVH